MLAATLVALVALVSVADASAFTQRPFEEEFGSVEKPDLEHPTAVVVDQESGDVLIADEGSGSIRRFHADGTPDSFQKLGTNVIDGAEANGKPCAGEPASCDKTPQDGIETAAIQIAIDESDGPTKGDIYVTQHRPEPGLVDVFAADGEYLGQLTGTGDRPFPQNEEPTGVAVDQSGVVYVSTGGSVAKFEPVASPVSNADFSTAFALPKETDARDLQLGSGPTAGSLFVSAIFAEVEGFGRRGNREVLRLDQETGQVLSKFGIGSPEGGVTTWITVNRLTGNLLNSAGLEYEFPPGSEPVRVGRLIPDESVQGGIAFTPGEKVIVGELRRPVNEGEGFRRAVSVYGPPAIVPTVTAAPAAEVTGTRASVAGTVDPAGGPPITKCVFEYGKAYETEEAFPEIRIQYEGEVACEGLDAEHPSDVGALISGLESNGQLYGFRLVAFNENGREETEGQTFKTAATVMTEPATSIGLTTATLNGVVRPEGSEYSACTFEYGLADSAAFEGSAPCNPPAGSLGEDFRPHEVSARITGLVSGREYRYRLVATSTDPEVGTVTGEEQRFTAAGLPRIEEIRASDADQSSVILEATVDPNGFGTTYRFEWGPTPDYGNLAPVEFAPYVGSGQEPIAVQAKLAGLAPGTAYHYRVIATNSRGTTQSPDHIAETLSSCGLPEGRCFELVSRSEAGPVGVPGEFNTGKETHFQAATEGPGGLAYPVEAGYPDATKGADVFYRALRGADGWESTQISSPLLAQNEREGVISLAGLTDFLSDDLTCGFTDSSQPLTANPSMNLVREFSGSNLYRINPDNTYTPVTTLPPENVKEIGGEIPDYEVAYASQDCGVVVFASKYAYPGVPTRPQDGGERLYEWRDGTLRNAGLVPGSGGEVSVPATAGQAGSGTFARDTQNSVSEDGSRIFFTAERQISPNPEEIGARAIFVREDGLRTRDISLSQTAVADEGATYQWATADGSKVFFIANSGLAAGTPGAGGPCSGGNGEGCDLYEYDLATGKLNDRTGPAADVFGFLAATPDGSTLYFASRDQIVPGSGPSREGNEKAGSFSIYRVHAKQGGGQEFSFAGTFQEGADEEKDLVAYQREWASQVSPDGRYLLFQSSGDVTGYDSEGSVEAYLFDDAESGKGAITCISCPLDGSPPLPRSGDYAPLSRTGPTQNELHPIRFLTTWNGGAQVFFTSPDVLAPGATVDQNNIYEWTHDQVFRLASSIANEQKRPYAGVGAVYGGAAEDGSDAYLVTPETLTWQDGDERLSAYDARVGGGFPEPAPAPAPCESTTEGPNTCLAAPQAVSEPAGPTSATDRGAQNVESKKKKANKKKHHTKKKHKRKHQKRKPKSKRQASRRGAGGDRRKGR